MNGRGSDVVHAPGAPGIRHPAGRSRVARSRKRSGGPVATPGAAYDLRVFDSIPHPANGAWVEPVVLEGDRVRLEPLGEGHLDGLVAACLDPAIWRWTTARPRDRAGLQEWLVQAIAIAASGAEVPFATIDRASGRLIGSTRFMAIVPEHRRLEIGWTMIAPAWQRTGANREAKLLQLEHAFERLAANRVEFKTDSRNGASRTALLGIGATFEGIFRSHMVMPEGDLRHSASYSIVREEWPAIKVRLRTGLRR
jgi:RimJ/RimL family protein N-acetyltransferase